MDLKNITIGIVGGGVVGSAIGRAFIEHVGGVWIYDIDPLKRNSNLVKVLTCDFTFVCLPTPQKEKEFGLDTSYLDDFFCSIVVQSNKSQTKFILKSTVPIGYTRQSQVKYALPYIVHSPEFLTARCASHDAQNPSRNIIGHVKSTDISYYNLVYQLYRSRFPHCLTLKTTSDESEAIKIFQNSFFATKITFFNECYLIAKKLGLDWEDILIGMLSDGRINPSHTQVPGPDGKLGFGGECLPKDLAQMIEHSRHLERDYESVTLAAYNYNPELRREP